VRGPEILALAGCLGPGTVQRSGVFLALAVGVGPEPFHLGVSCGGRGPSPCGLLLAMVGCGLVAGGQLADLVPVGNRGGNLGISIGADPASCWSTVPRVIRELSSCPARTGSPACPVWKASSSRH
jgi:hypothetical protein